MYNVQTYCVYCRYTWACEILSDVLGLTETKEGKSGLVMHGTSQITGWYTTANISEIKKTIWLCTEAA